MSIKHIGQGEWENEAISLLSEFFSNPNPTHLNPSLKRNDLLEHQLVLNRTGYYLTDLHNAEAYKNAMKAIGENGFYVYESALIHQAHNSLNGKGLPGMHYVPIGDADDCYIYVDPLENVIFSETASWAILFLWDDFSILTCTDKFLGELEKQLPDLQLEVYDFLKDWMDYQIHYDEHYEWIEPFLVTVYGEAKGQHLFQYFLSLDTRNS